MSIAYEKLATQAREWLSHKPRPATEDVAYVMLLDIAKEFEVPQPRHEDFAERLLPALVTLVSSARSKIIREMEEEAARAYFAKPISDAGESAIHDSKSTLAAPTPALGAGGDGHGVRAFHTRNAALPAPESEAQASSEAHTTRDAPTPASGGPSRHEPQAGTAALPESERGDGDPIAVEAQKFDVASPAPASVALGRAEPIHVALPTPLSRRQDVLDGWRALRDEVMFVPDHGTGESGRDITYGSATVPQIDRAITYQHNRAKASVDKARRLRVLRDVLTDSNVACLDELLTGKAS